MDRPPTHTPPVVKLPLQFLEHFVQTNVGGDKIHLRQALWAAWHKADETRRRGDSLVRRRHPNHLWDFLEWPQYKSSTPVLLLSLARITAHEPCTATSSTQIIILNTSETSPQYLYTALTLATVHTGKSSEWILYFLWADGSQCTLGIIGAHLWRSTSK